VWALRGSCLHLAGGGCPRVSPKKEKKRQGQTKKRRNQVDGINGNLYDTRPTNPSLSATARAPGGRVGDDQRKNRTPSPRTARKRLGSGEPSLKGPAQKNGALRQDVASCVGRKKCGSIRGEKEGEEDIRGHQKKELPSDSRSVWEVPICNAETPAARNRKRSSIYRETTPLRSSYGADERKRRT